ncbi:MAG: SGNH/GDSL hydrolase family protein [Rhodopirellula sp.]|nr:SGNH/GDSL hydrolase family protein [Rhodopirellula sp.]
MSKSLRSVILAFAVLTLCHTRQAESAPSFQFVDSDRVVLLGDTFFERAQRYGWLETALQLRFPKENIHFRNLGWSGDTVFAESRGIFDPPAKGYARMLEQVRDLKPTVIMLNYGGNEAFNGPEYIDTFVKQYGQLLDDLASTQARMVLVSPLPLFNAGAPLPKPDKHNAIRKRFVNAVQQLARERSLHYVDIWSPVEQKLEQFTSPLMTDEGVHLTNFGYGVVSTIFVRALAGDSIEATPNVALGPTVATTEAPIRQDHYTVRDSSRTLQASLQARSQAAGIRISASQLKAGAYEIRSNNSLQGVMSGSQLTNSALSEFGSVAMLDVEELRQTIVEKNEMYFYRWRPQNVTYLFLFRKHEQGNNAKEVDEFLPIISRLEERIFELKRKPRTITVNIVGKTDPEN